MYAEIFDKGPKPLYIHRPVVNAHELVAWAKANGFETTLPASDLHVTIAYSKEPVNWVSMGDAPETLAVKAYGFERLGETGDAFVMKVGSLALERRFDELINRGCSWDWPEYTPHITLSYKAGDVSIEALKVFEGDIILGPEVFEVIQDDWKDNLVEKAET